MKKVLLILILFLLIFPCLVFAGRPLSTNDAGTADKQHLELEFGFEYANKADNEYNWSAVCKYGLEDRWDIGIEIPYQYIAVSEGDDVDGLADVVLCSKYRFLEESEELPALALSFTIKTRTGDDDQGLDSGELDYALNTILSKELDKIVAHLNLGYTYVGAPEGESDDDLFSYGLACEYPFNDRLNLVAEITGETNFTGVFDKHPLAMLAGFNYALSDALTVDLGIGWGLSDASTDYTITTGLTRHFKKGAKDAYTGWIFSGQYMGAGLVGFYRRTGILFKENSANA